MIKKQLHVTFRFSVKARITLWFTMFITLVVILSLSFIYQLSNKMTTATVKERLIQTVENARTSSKHHDDKLSTQSSSSVGLASFDEDKTLTEGNIPDSLNDISFLPGKVRYYNISENRYYIYDQKYMSKSRGTLWIRGYVCLDSLHTANSSLLKLILIFFPLLIVIAAKGGYFITGKTLDPVIKMTRTANAISGSNDLSMRIDLSDMNNPNDEFYILGQTFNQMFERLELSSLKERQFTSDASHELRTPTTIILAQSDYLSTMPASEPQKKAIDSILRQAKRMSALISDLLLFARADQNRQTLVPEPFNFSELMEMVIEELSSAAKVKGISISSKIEEGVIVKGDQTMLMRMLINLITNAIQYGRQNGFIKITLNSCPTGLTCSIKDNGIGICKDHLPKIWDRFYQADPSRKHDNSSSGLGLSMVKWIIHAHHGSISVESEPGEGSEFSFWLPKEQD